MEKNTSFLRTDGELWIWMGKKYSCSQSIPLHAAILLALATEHWFGVMDSGPHAEATLKRLDKNMNYRLT